MNYLFILIIDELIIYVSLIKLKRNEIIMIFRFLRNQTSGPSAKITYLAGIK
jgi:hypothetical protein